MGAEHKTYSPEATGARVTELRRAGRRSQAWLAAEMGDRGFRWHATTVARVEHGKRRVTLEEAAGLAVIFAVALDDLGLAA